MRFLVLATGPQGLGPAGARLRQTLAVYLSGELGVQLDVVALADYSDLTRAVTTGTASVAWLPPAVYVAARAKYDVALLGRTVRHGSGTYRGGLIVRAESHLVGIEDLRGKIVAWVDPDSCAGYLFPRATMREEGLDPNSHFGEERFAGSHAAVARAVARGEVDAGANYMHLLDDEVVDCGWARVVGIGALRPIMTSSVIPGDTLCASAALDETLRREVAALLSRLHETPDGQSILQGLFQATSIEAADPADYVAVEQAMASA